MYKIFPATISQDGRKIPLIEGWQEKATTDPVIISQWQEFFRDRIKLWGIPTGDINGIFALDIDVKGVNGYDTLKSMGIAELPKTTWQHTMSGGMHLIFKTKPGVRHPNSVDRKKGLDLRGDGGWIATYQLNPLPLIEAPDWVYDLAKPKAQSTDVNSQFVPHPEISKNLFNEAIEKILAAGEGERNHTLNTQCFVIGQLIKSGAVNREYAEGEIYKAAKHIGLDDFEIKATSRSGIGGGLIHPATVPFDVKPPESVFKIPEIPKVVEKLRFTPRFSTESELFDWTKLRKPQLFEDWSTEDIILTSAVGGVGKTTLKLYEAVCLALGEPFLGFKCLHPGRTIFITGEDTEAKIRATLGRICKDMGLTEPDQRHKLQQVIENVLVKKSTDLCLVSLDFKTRMLSPHPDAMSRIMEAVEDLKPRQIIFDPIASFWGPESAINDMAMALSKFMMELQERSNASIDMIAHIGKVSARDENVDQFAARGGSALPNHSRIVRTFINMTKQNFKEQTGEELADRESAMKIFVSKFTDGSPLLGEPFIIKRQGYTFHRVSTVARSSSEQREVSIIHIKDRIYKHIKENSSEDHPLTRKFIEAYFSTQADKIKVKDCKDAITLLMADSLVEELEHPDHTRKELWIRIKT